jgi:hypothetical protein
MPFDMRKLGQFRVHLLRRIADLKANSEESLAFAMETMLQDRLDSFFRIEEGFTDIVQSLQAIEADLPLVTDLASAQRLEARLEFLEDRYDELDSEVRQRPRRRRRRINLMDFFKAAGGSETVSSERKEVLTISEAYEILGVEFGSPLAAVTRAFRTKAKQFHPDARQGDRSSEPELRRTLEAYQLLKEYLSLSNTKLGAERRGSSRPFEEDL